jgi:hypothetical protein
MVEVLASYGTYERHIAPATTRISSGMQPPQMSKRLLGRVWQMRADVLLERLRQVSESVFSGFSFYGQQFVFRGAARSSEAPWPCRITVIESELAQDIKSVEYELALEST